jgi:hypothetical protein
VLLAFVHMTVDEKDRAFALLEQAYAARDPLLISIQVGEVGGVLQLPEGRVATLRSDPRFRDLVRRMGLVPREGSPDARGPS